MICLWLENILDIITNQSAINTRFEDSLTSFKLNCQLAAVGHGCARTVEAVVTIVTDYGQGCARITNVQNRDTMRAMSVYMLYLTDTGMSVKEIRLYSDPVPSIFFIEVRLYTSDFMRAQCFKRNIMRFVHKFIFTLQIRIL